MNQKIICLNGKVYEVNKEGIMEEINRNKNEVDEIEVELWQEMMKGWDF